MALKSTYKTDAALESGGVWVSTESGDRVCIRRMNAPEVEEVSRKAFAPYENILRRPGAKLPEKVSLEIMAKILSEAIVVDWEVRIDPKDDPIPFSKAKAAEIFRDYPEFGSEILEYAKNRDLFKSEVDQEAAGNSGPL